MKSRVIDRSGMLDARELESIERRLHFALSRYAGEVTRVCLEVLEVQAARPGFERECRIQVQSRKIGDLTVTGRGGELASVVADATDRMGRTLARRLDPWGGATAVNPLPRMRSKA